jgi:hypothetical protein
MYSNSWKKWREDTVIYTCCWTFIKSKKNIEYFHAAPDGTVIRNRRGLTTWLMVKENGRCQMAIMHNAELPLLQANK